MNIFTKAVHAGDAESPALMSPLRRPSHGVAVIVYESIQQLDDVVC